MHEITQKVDGSCRDALQESIMVVFRSTWLRVCIVIGIIASLVILVLVEAGHYSPRPLINNLSTKIGYRVTKPQTSNDVVLNPGKGWVLYGLPSDHTAS